MQTIVIFINTEYRPLHQCRILSRL
jgi:hypothetical protein